VAAAIRTVAVCHPQVPFSDGGAERLADGLVSALQARGLAATLVTVPFQWQPRDRILRSALAWRLLDLAHANGRPIDLVIATKFPSYAVAHERKVTWLVHQFRQVYELRGTPYSDFGDAAEDAAMADAVRRIDARTLGEARARFAISQRVADRLRRYNQLDAEVLHPPPLGRERFTGGPAGDYVLSVGRLEPLKRVAPLIEALPHADPSLRCVVVGAGPEEMALRARAEALGVADRVAFRGAASFDEVLALYRDCLAVYFAPYDEDYGFVTVEAFLCRKPVVTAPDAGGPLEFVEDQVTGLVTGLDPEPLGAALSALARDRKWARGLGEAGHERVRALSWEPVVERLLEAAR
jgi:glycosyltransferase involved in cell wall biosynthesis